MPLGIIDSHMHLWPADVAEPTTLPWIASAGDLQKEHNVHDYLASARVKPELPVSGVVYIETDRSHANGDDEAVAEARYLGELCRTSTEASKLVKGIVIWAPISSPEALDEFLEKARAAMGEELFDARVCGVRFLLQRIQDRGVFVDTALGQGTAGALRRLKQMRGGRGLVFDVGIDARLAGIWQLEDFDTLVSMARGVEVHGEALRGTEDADTGCTFVLNHLCKPSFDQNDFEDWASAVSNLARHTRVYMKLSGAFSELMPPKGESDPASVYARIKPWVEHIFKEFGPQRIMFGSDWPVCNWGGPNEHDTWSLWHSVVQIALDEQGSSLDEQARQDLHQRVWSGTAIEAYGLTVD